MKYNMSQLCQVQPIRIVLIWGDYKSLPGDSDFFSVEVTGGILLLELLCMERLLAVTEGELEESTGRLDIETGLLEFPGASVG